MFKHLKIFLPLMLVSGQAFADGAAPKGAPMSQFLILGVFILFIFWMMRSQNKKAKDHQNLIQKLDKGDEVVISGGLVGKITKSNEQFLSVQFADGVEIIVQRSMIATSLPKGTMKSIKF